MDSAHDSALRFAAREGVAHLMAVVALRHERCALLGVSPRKRGQMRGRGEGVGAVDVGLEGRERQVDGLGFRFVDRDRLRLIHEARRTSADRELSLVVDDDEVAAFRVCEHGLLAHSVSAEDGDHRAVHGLSGRRRDHALQSCRARGEGGPKDAQADAQRRGGGGRRNRVDRPALHRHQRRCEVGMVLQLVPRQISLAQRKGPSR